METTWDTIREEAKRIIERENALTGLINDTILERSSLGEALSYRLTRKLDQTHQSKSFLRDVFIEAFTNDPKILDQVSSDIKAICHRDPACPDYVTPFLYYKGFQAITCYRVSHWLWNQGRKDMAFYIESLVNEVFGIDIHPAAKIGCGLLLDHATGFVAGETAVIENNVSILHEVTLGGTGKETGDRHPKIRSGVLIGAGAKILGNVEIGVGAKIGASSVVLKNVAPHTSVAGVPAKVIKRHLDIDPAEAMNHCL